MEFSSFSFNLVRQKTSSFVTLGNYEYILNWRLSLVNDLAFLSFCSLPLSWIPTHLNTFVVALNRWMTGFEQFRIRRCGAIFRCRKLCKKWAVQPQVQTTKNDPKCWYNFNWNYLQRCTNNDNLSWIWSILRSHITKVKRTYNTAHFLRFP